MTWSRVGLVGPPAGLELGRCKRIESRQPRPEGTAATSVYVWSWVAQYFQTTPVCKAREFFKSGVNRKKSLSRL